MPEPKRPLKVFLSYASQDKLLVRELSRRLVGEGWIDTWQDEKNLLPGQDWRVKIEEAVEDADVVIIVLSQHSVSKEGHVQKELRYAREIALEKPEDAIFLIPLRLDECEVPRGLRFYQWVDYFGDNKDSSYKALVASLKLRYEQKIKAEEAESLRKEQHERGIAERIAREKAEKDATEKSRLEAEELARQKTAKEKAEREATERVEKERKAKELREKQAHEAREKEKHESKKKEEKPVAVKPKSGSQIAYWFGGFIVLALGIILFSSLNNPLSTPQPTPESAQTQAIATLAQDTAEPSLTAIPKSTSTPASKLTPTFIPGTIVLGGKSINWSGQPITFDNVDSIKELVELQVGVTSEDLQEDNLRISQDGKYIVYILGKAVYTLRTDNGENDLVYQTSNGIDCIDINRDSNIFVTVTHPVSYKKQWWSDLYDKYIETEIKIWKLGDRTLLQTIRYEKNYDCPIVLSPDGTKFAGSLLSRLSSSSYRSYYTSPYSIINIEKLSDKSVLAEIKDIDVFRLVGFSPNNSLLVVRDFDHNVYVWNMDTRTVVKSYSLSDTAIFSQDGQLLAIFQVDGGVKIWKVEDWSLYKEVDSVYPPGDFYAYMDRVASNGKVYIHLLGIP